MSEAPVEGGGAAREQRLHPWSWLFVLLQQLRQFIVPLLVLLFAGRRGASDGWVTLAPLLGVGVLVVVSILQYFTFRYRIGSDAITLRSGLLQRSWREIPFARIHNVGLHQSLLHRVFGVAEVRLESAGGDKPEASCACSDYRMRWRWSGWCAIAAQPAATPAPMAPLRTWVPAPARTRCWRCRPPRCCAWGWCPIAA